eukprot:3092717-Rhodomonas_salina.1
MVGGRGRAAACSRQITSTQVPQPRALGSRNTSTPNLKSNTRNRFLRTDCPEIVHAARNHIPRDATHYRNAIQGDLQSMVLCHASTAVIAYGACVLLAICFTSRPYTSISTLCAVLTVRMVLGIALEEITRCDCAVSGH